MENRDIRFMHDLQRFDDLLTASRRLVLVPHISPDGDAVGSCLGLQHALRAEGHDSVQVVAANDVPPFLNWLPGADDIIIHEHDHERAEAVIAAADLVICLDFNALHRSGDSIHDLLERSDAPTVLIDHHLGTADWPTVDLADPTASSTCELVFRHLSARTGSADFLTPDLAACLYTGLMTDTGNFMFSATSPAVHHMAADLIAAGVQPQEVHDRVNNSFTASRLKFFGHCISERMTWVPGKRFAYMLVPQAEMERFDIGTGGTEGLVNEPMKISDVRIAALFKEAGDRVKISFRSKGETDVAAFLNAHFSGGGHRNAAGGIFHGSLVEAEAHLLDNLDDLGA